VIDIERRFALSDAKTLMRSYCLSATRSGLIGMYNARSLDPAVLWWSDRTHGETDERACHWQSN